MKLLAITDDRHTVADLASIIIQINDMVDFVHIREKSKKADELLTLLKLLEEGNVAKEKLVIHDRLDAAVLSNIPNIHLPAHGFPINSVREHFPYLRIGCSIHSYDEARNAAAAGADYLLYGHVFETNSKKGKPPRGINEMTEIKARLQIPVYAIGGMTADRINVIRQTKADGIAVMSGIFSSENPAAAAQHLLEKCRS